MKKIKGTILAVCLLFLSGCSNESTIPISKEDYNIVKGDADTANNQYIVREIKVDVENPFDEVNFYQTDGNRFYYVHHKDMDMRTFANEVEIGYWDDAAGEKYTVLTLTDENGIWVNEMQVWEDCLVWEEIRVLQSIRIIKYDLVEKKQSVLRETVNSGGWSSTRKGRNLLFYEGSSIVQIDIDSGESQVSAVDTAQISGFERVKWTGDTVCYPKLQDGALTIFYENQKTRQSINLLMDSQYIGRITANEDFILWEEFVGPGDYTDSTICAYDIREQKLYKYKPPERFLLFQVCSNGALINIMGKEEEGSLREWNIREGTLSTVFVKDNAHLHTGIMMNGDKGWTIRIHGDGYEGTVYIEEK